MENIIDIMLYISYGLLAVALVGAVLLPIWKSLDNPKSLIKPVVAIIAIVILLGICYAIASPDLNNRLIQAGATEGVSKFVGGALLTMYVLFAIALVGVVVTEFNKAIK